VVLPAGSVAITTAFGSVTEHLAEFALHSHVAGCVAVFEILPLNPCPAVLLPLNPAGMICPHIVNWSMLLGALLSWGFMWPLMARKEGDWYPAGLGSHDFQGLFGYKVGLRSWGGGVGGLKFVFLGQQQQVCGVVWLQSYKVGLSCAVSVVRGCVHEQGGGTRTGAI
jgi:hypothetical protein